MATDTLASPAILRYNPTKYSRTSSTASGSNPRPAKPSKTAILPTPAT